MQNRLKDIQQFEQTERTMAQWQSVDSYKCETIQGALQSIKSSFVS